MTTFCPNGDTVTLAVTSGGGSARVALPTLDGICGAVRILKSSGTPGVFIKFGDGTVSASASDMPIGDGPQIFKVPVGATHIAGFQGSANLFITAGQI